MGNLFFSVEQPKFFNLKSICQTHGWSYLAPFTWDNDSKTLFLKYNHNEHTISIRIKHEAQLSIYAQSKSSLPSREEVYRVIERVLSLHFDIKELYQTSCDNGVQYSKLIKSGFGRILCSPTLWEDAAKTLFTTNCSWTLTKIMCEQLCSPKFHGKQSKQTFHFASPDLIVSKGCSEVSKLSSVGYRCKSLVLLANKIMHGVPLNITTEASAYDQFIELHGFGNYSAAHMLLLSGYFSRIPVDSIVQEYANIHFGGDIDTMARHYQTYWGKWAWWGYKFDRMLEKSNWLGD